MRSNCDLNPLDPEPFGSEPFGSCFCVLLLDPAFVAGVSPWRIPAADPRCGSPLRIPAADPHCGSPILNLPVLLWRFTFLAVASCRAKCKSKSGRENDPQSIELSEGIDDNESQTAYYVDRYLAAKRQEKEGSIDTITRASSASIKVQSVVISGNQRQSLESGVISGNNWK